MTTLPDKPSELLRMGLEDFAKIEADPRYVVDLRRWHLPDGAACRVGVTGAVMARRLGVLPEKYTWPFDFDDETRRRLSALDYLRAGGTDMAGYYLGNKALRAFPSRIIPQYTFDPAAWRAALEQFATDLEAAGL
jgi:hypothetical protein